MNGNDFISRGVLATLVIHLFSYNNIFWMNLTMRKSKGRGEEGIMKGSENKGTKGEQVLTTNNEHTKAII